MNDSKQHEHHVDLNNYIRRCAIVFVCALIAISLMVWASYLNTSWSVRVTLILAIAICNAFIVAGFLMHLLTEKKMIYTVMGFTVIFFAGLMGLTVWAMNDFPLGTAVH
jgi:caa(3)-type oxidase subunit IV